MLDFFRKKKSQPKTDATPAPVADALAIADPGRLEAVKRKSKEFLALGQVPESLYVCRAASGTNRGLLTLPLPAGQGVAMLLFSSSFAAADYLRTTKTNGTVGEFKVVTLPEMVQSWLASGVQALMLDRCPRCPQSLSIPIGGSAPPVAENFAKIWAVHRATRLVFGESRLREAIANLGKAPAVARSHLEYVRDHFDCGIPYLHQMIGLLAGMEGNEIAKAESVARLKEFGPNFAVPLDFSVELLATAMVALTTIYGITPVPSAKPVP